MRQSYNVIGLGMQIILGSEAEGLNAHVSYNQFHEIWNTGSLKVRGCGIRIMRHLKLKSYVDQG